MRRCALEYLWGMLPTNLNYHQRVPSLIEDCYSEDPTLLYKPHILLRLVKLAEQHKLIAILPLLYYYIAQWPLDWITDGVPAASMESDLPSRDSRIPFPSDLAIIILAGREKLMRIRGLRSSISWKLLPLPGRQPTFPSTDAIGRRDKDTEETCFQRLMQVWFYMDRVGFIARPAALDVMNMGQWAELKMYCCEACAKRTAEHMLAGRDYIWDAPPNVFRFRSWKDVVEQQKKVEEAFAAVIS